MEFKFTPAKQRREISVRVINAVENFMFMTETNMVNASANGELAVEVNPKDWESMCTLQQEKVKTALRDAGYSVLRSLTELEGIETIRISW